MPTPYDSADADLLEEIISQGEKRLQAQLELGKAADQRAMTFAGLLLAGVAVLAALAFGDHPAKNYQPDLVVVAFGFILSAALAGRSARPVAWEVVGNVPENYLDDIAAKLTLKNTRAETAFHLQDMISKNERVLKCNSNWMLASMTVALISATGGIIGALFGG